MADAMLRKKCLPKTLTPCMGYGFLVPLDAPPSHFLRLDGGTPAPSALATRKFRVALKRADFQSACQERTFASHATAVRMTRGPRSLLGLSGLPALMAFTSGSRRSGVPGLRPPCPLGRITRLGPVDAHGPPFALILFGEDQGAWACMAQTPRLRLQAHTGVCAAVRLSACLYLHHSVRRPVHHLIHQLVHQFTHQFVAC